MELLKLNRSLPGPGPGAALCRPEGPLLNGSGAGNLSCEPPRIRGAGTRDRTNAAPLDPRSRTELSQSFESPRVNSALRIPTQ
uniref:Uncharacterized protein n=1 Tax=Sus scrofa TaxID=9823 RepID=A0A8D0V2G5_PIG